MKDSHVAMCGGSKFLVYKSPVFHYFTYLFFHTLWIFVYFPAALSCNFNTSALMILQGSRKVRLSSLTGHQALSGYTGKGSILFPL